MPRPEDPNTSEETRRDWEMIQQNDTDITERLRIVHGWLYRTIVNETEVAMVFVPSAD